MNLNNICIVGGGTSGWMLAAAMEKHSPSIKVTLVESPEVGNIGVGESTVPVVSRFIEDYLGFEEKEWMPFCDAVYKTSIKFNNFKNLEHSLYHPFWGPREGELNGLNWAVKKALDASTSSAEYYQSYYSSVLMSRDNTFKKTTDFNYAHHLDATKFGEFCKNHCSSINHVIGHISEVPLTSEGAIDKLVFRDGRTIRADLYIDCTGFSALLLGKTLKEEFIYSKDYLLNDSAVVTRIPYEEDSKKDEVLPYTDCTALTAGWVWNIPLWSRVGVGYVYSSSYASKEEAQEEFKQHLKERFGSRAEEAEFAHIPIKAGRYKRPWVKNCASLVLSSGFVEPLESTGLALMVLQVKTLVSLFSAGTYNSLDRDIFNTASNTHVDEVVDFISVHYSSTDRCDSPYWKHINSNISIPYKITGEMNTICKEEKSVGGVFTYKSWENIMIGFGIKNTPYYDGQDLFYDNKFLYDMTEAEKSLVLEKVTQYLKSLRSDNENKALKYENHLSYLNTHIYNI